MSLRSGAEPSEPVGRLPGVHEERRATRSLVLATGTMACPRCDAPVLPDGPLTPAAPAQCPFCAHRAPARDFVSLAAPIRPARVQLRVVPRGPLAARLR